MIPPSVHTLAALAAREAGADGYAVYLQDASVYTRLGGDGLPIPENDLLRNGGSTATYALHASDTTAALLAFSFHSHACTSAAKSRLRRMIAAIEQVWRTIGTPSELAETATRIGELEMQLADSKIASRARGLLEHRGDYPPDVVETVTRHVQNVLRPFESAALLEKRRKELESELEERDLTDRAKTLLQQQSGLSEDAAHLHLRMLSRKTRRPLREVALDVLANTLVAN